jgi:hypothetical protein
LIAVSLAERDGLMVIAGHGGVRSLACVVSYYLAVAVGSAFVVVDLSLSG